MDRVRNFGFILKNLERLYSKRFEALAQELSLTLGQCKALYLLARNEGASQKRLSELAEIEPMTLVRILDRMEADGWIERRPDPQDRRARCLYLTAGATPVLQQIDRLSAQMRGEALQGLSAKERDVLMSLLERIHGNLTSQKTAAPTDPLRPAAAAAKPAIVKPLSVLVRKKAK